MPTFTWVRQVWSDRSFQIPLRLWLAVRVITLLIGVLAVNTGGPIVNIYSQETIFRQSLDARQRNSPLAPLVEPWHRWDTGWYLKIAQYGYSATDGTIIFAPLYPVSMAALGVLVGDKLLAGLIINSIASLLFMIAVYKMAVDELGTHRLATNALVALIAFPTAFYLQAAYTEGLFLALTAWALLSARRHWWWLCGVLGLLAALTRPQGWVLFFPVGWVAFVEAPRFWQSGTWLERIRQAIPRLWAIGAAPTAVLIFYIYLYVSGLGTVTDSYEKQWSMTVAAPWAAVIDTIGRILAGTAKATEIANLVAVFLIFYLLFLCVRNRFKLFYHLYLWPTLFLILLRYYPAILLNGTLRYVLDFFPVFIVLGAVLARHRVVRLLWVSLGLLIQIFMVYLFARWMWIA